MLKTIPYYFYQVDAIESWLDEQAQKGLFLLETRLGTAMSFRKETPRAVRYRIDVKRSIGYTDEKARIAAYREMGWEYVCDLTPYLDIYRCDDPAAPELNTDEETLHQVLDRRLRSDIRRGYAGILFAVVWCGWNLYEALRIDGGLYSSLLSGYALVALCWVLLGGFWLVRLRHTRRGDDAAAHPANAGLSLHRNGASEPAPSSGNKFYAGAGASDHCRSVDHPRP